MWGDPVTAWVQNIFVTEFHFIDHEKHFLFFCQRGRPEHKSEWKILKASLSQRETFKSIFFSLLNVAGSYGRKTNVIRTEMTAER